MKTSERAALDFALAYIERHGLVVEGEIATQHRLMLAQEAAVESEPDATGCAGLIAGPDSFRLYSPGGTDVVFGAD